MVFFFPDVLPKVETRVVLVGEAGNIAELEKALQVPKLSLYRLSFILRQDELHYCGKIIYQTLLKSM